MKGSIREKRPGVWELLVELPKDPATGERRRKWATVKGSKRKAEFELQKLLVNAQDAKKRASSASVEYVVHAWFESARLRLTQKTIYNYEWRIEKHILPALGAFPIDKLTAVHIDELYHELEAEGNKVSSIRYTHAVLRRALNQAIKWGWLESNPAMRASPPRATQTDMQSVSLTQLAVLISDAEKVNLQWASMIILAAVSGMRRGEMLGLKWSDIEDGAIRIRRSLGYTPKDGIFEGPTKTRQTRRIALDQIGMAVIERQKEEIRFAANKVGVPVASDPYLFSPEPDGGKPFHPDSISKVFRRIADLHDWRDLHFHSLRHFSATEMIAAGVDVRTVAARLGHADASVTLRVYSHALPERDRAAAELLGSRISLAQPPDR